MDSSQGDAALEPPWREHFVALATELAEEGVSQEWEVAEPDAPIGVAQGGYRLHPPDVSQEVQWVLRSVDRHGDYFVASFSEPGVAANFLRAILLTPAGIFAKTPAVSDVGYNVVRSSDRYLVVHRGPAGSQILASCYEEQKAATFAIWLNAHG